MRKTSIAMLTLSLSSCLWILEAPSHLTKLPDDENIGKTIIIYPTAGDFELLKSWYLGKKSGDSFFYSSSPKSKIVEGEPTLYKITAEYRESNHGLAKELNVKGRNRYLLEPVNKKFENRLFFTFDQSCSELTDSNDPETGLKIDFVCKRNIN